MATKAALPEDPELRALVLQIERDINRLTTEHDVQKIVEALNSDWVKLKVYFANYLWHFPPKR